MPAWTWGAAGHHIVAIIAQQRLSPAVREKIRSLLFDGKYSLEEISTCADHLRGNGRGAPRPEDLVCRDLAGTVPPSNATWHYIDIPLPTQSKTLAPFCPDDNCATAQIRRFSEILRTSTDDAARRQALLFLVHFVGDIHQPLHAIERACDRGGNSEHVNFYLGDQKHANETLHSAWDSDEVNLLMKNSNATDVPKFAAGLNTSIKPGQARKWARASADQMAWESYKLAKKYAYRGIPFQSFCDNQRPAPLVTDLPLSYEEAGAKVAREQLQKAGVRLAAILEHDLGGQP